MKKLFFTFALLLVSTLAHADDVADTNALLAQENCQFSGSAVDSPVTCKSGSLADVAKKIVLPFDAKAKLLTTPGTDYKFRIRVINPDQTLGQQRATKIFNDLKPAMGNANYSSVNVVEAGNHLLLDIFKPKM